MHEVGTMLKLVLFLAKEEFHLIRDILRGWIILASVCILSSSTVSANLAS